jgi:hypothetical protein
MVAALLLLSPASTPAEPLDFPERALTELADLREETTLTAWMQDHPDDHLRFFAPGLWDIGDNWIARAELKGKLADGREFSRRAFFYVPDPPPDFLLPRHIEPQTLRARARLGCIWLETNGVSEDDAERTRVRLSQRFPGGQYDQKLWFANAAYWTRTARWKVGSSTLVSAYESIPGAQRPARVLAFGFLPVSKLYVDLAGDTDDFFQKEFETRRRTIDEAVAASGLPRKDLKEIIYLAETVDAYHAGRSDGRNAVATNEILDALKRWLGTTRHRGRQQFAAGLLAADAALSLLESFINVEDTAVRKKLTAIGARYDDTHYGPVYTHNWLNQAYRLNRHGPVGDLSLISMMERGFAMCPDCADTGYEGFRGVIFEGKRFLSRSKDSKLRARVRVLLARAYSDIVALAGGGGGGYVEASKYRREAAWARRMALVHYRAALRSRDASEERNKIWKSAWRLQAHIPPAETWFFCVSD